MVEDVRITDLEDEVRALRKQVEELTRSDEVVVPPWLPVAFGPVRPQDLPTVTSSSFETVWEARFTKLYPFVALTTVQGCDEGTVGAAQLVATDLDTGAEEVVDAWPLGVGVAWARRGPYELSDDKYPGEVRLSVRYRRSKGAGAVRASVVDAAQHPAD
jgi:hypothetical protein